MTANIQRIVSFVAKLEALLTDYDEFHSIYEGNYVRLELLRRFAAGGGEDFLEQTNTLETRAEEARIYGEGVETLIVELTALPTAEDARQYLTQLKTILNMFMEAVSNEFKTTHELSTKTAEELVSLGISLLPE